MIIVIVSKYEMKVSLTEGNAWSMKSPLQERFLQAFEPWSDSHQCFDYTLWWDQYHNSPPGAWRAYSGAKAERDFANTCTHGFWRMLIEVVVTSCSFGRSRFLCPQGQGLYKRMNVNKSRFMKSFVWRTCLGHFSFDDSFEKAHYWRPGVEDVQ